MDQTVYTALFLLKFIAFMAMVYLGLHMLIVRLGADPEGKLVGFFALLTSPLTRPVRRFVPSGTAEPRVRRLAFATLFLLWLVVTVVAALIRPAAG